MSMLRKLKAAIINPKKLVLWTLNRCAKLLPDKLYLKLKFRLHMNKWMDFDNPQTFNEKLQWLKLNDRNPLYVSMVDKVDAKKYVASIIGEEHIIPTLGVYNSFEEIDFDKLPNQFVLKCSHDSGGVIICKDKSQLDMDNARKVLSNGLKRNYYYQTREWPYKNVKPRIIAEQFMVDESGIELKDYKYYCFDGKVKMMFVATGRPYDTRFDFFGTNFNHLPVKQGYDWADKPISKPLGFDEMISLAEKLSKNIPHVRIDFYDINGQIYFGEMTFFDSSGWTPLEPVEWDYKMGSWINLPKQ